MLQIDKFAVELVLNEDILGTVPKNRDVYTRFIQTKAREQMEKDAKKGVPLTNGDAATAESITALLEPEAETIAEVEERGWTTFHGDHNGPFLFDYAIKGFLQEAARTLKERDGDGDGAPPEEVEEQDKQGEDAKKKKAKASPAVVKQLQDKVKRYVFVKPRKIYLAPAGTELACIERPLRAQTAQGPRVTVVRSDVVPAGTKISFEVHVLHGGGITRAILADVLSYGGYMGLGQWRSGGYGRFDVVKLEKL